jgi:uncharacterized repeat protein (TIGR03806 family)
MTALGPDFRRDERGLASWIKLLPVVAALAIAACTPPKPAAPTRDQLILAEEPAEKLSAYGFFTDSGARQLAEDVVAYDLVNALFSDHAGKHRFVYVPKGKTIAYSAEGVFDLPVGAVLIKTFAFAPDMRAPAKDERYIETRLLVRKADGWKAYAYIWNKEQTEATYSPAGGTEPIDTVTAEGAKVHLAYAIPNQNQCKSCHQVGDSIAPIGPAARHLNHAGPAGVNQIADWSARGILTGAPSPEQAEHEPGAFDTSQPIEARARAWLDINCAHCHKANGGASNSGLFLSWRETSPTGWGVDKRPVAAGRGSGQDFFVIAPGQPDASILVHRIESVEAGVLMPELGRSVRDETSIALVREWIAGMKR